MPEDFLRVISFSLIYSEISSPGTLYQEEYLRDWGYSLLTKDLFKLLEKFSLDSLLLLLSNKRFLETSNVSLEGILDPPETRLYASILTIL